MASAASGGLAGPSSPSAAARWAAAGSGQISNTSRIRFSAAAGRALTVRNGSPLSPEILLMIPTG